jgi:diguanylate cyclase (GGDEF)-like protein
VAWDNVVLRDADGRVVGTASVGQDVTDKRAAEAALAESEAFARGVLEASPDCVKTLDLEGRLRTMNGPGMCLMEVDDFCSVEGADWPAFWARGGREAEARAAVETARAGGTARFDGFCPTAKGVAKWWDVAVTPIPAPDGSPARLLCVSREITALKRAEEALHELSTRDELTGLLNRRGFSRMASQELKSATRTRRLDALLFVDLDRFKAINDTHGHAAGDAALRDVGAVIRATIRDADFAARFGGDEFAIYAVGMRRGEGETMAARLRHALDEHNDGAARAGRAFRVELSIGVAELEGGDDLDALLARADAALYAQKAARRPLCGTPG